MWWHAHQDTSPRCRPAHSASLGQNAEAAVPDAVPPLDAVARQGARQMLIAAIKAEVEQSIKAHDDARDGRRPDRAALHERFVVVVVVIRRLWWSIPIGWVLLNV